MYIYYTYLRSNYVYKFCTQVKMPNNGLCLFKCDNFVQCGTYVGKVGGTLLNLWRLMLAHIAPSPCSLCFIKMEKGHIYQPSTLMHLLVAIVIRNVVCCDFNIKLQQMLL